MGMYYFVTIFSDEIINNINTMILFKYICKRNQHYRIPYRLFSLNASESKNNSVKTRLSPNVKHANEVYNYLKANEASHLFKEIPVHFLEKKATTKYILINPFIAKKISYALKLYLNGSYVLESDPGLGLLSKELIHTVSYLRLYEEDVLLRSHLREFLNKHRQKIEIFDGSLQSIRKLQMEDDISNGTRMVLLFDNIPTDIRVNMLVIAPYKKVIASWIKHILEKSYFSKFQQLDFYFFIPPSVYTRLIASPQNDYYPRYQRFSVLSQVLFDIELLINDIPRKAFLPWPKRPVTKKNPRDIEKYENDHEVMYFVRMSLKPENLAHLQDENIFQCFVSFVNQNMTGKRRIVPYFETIIPGSGARVIMLGYNIYSTFNELNPTEIFSLFLQFTKWPEFQITNFQSYCQNKSPVDIDEASMETMVGTLQSTHDVDIHDEDDNDDDAFLPGNNVK